MDVVDPREFIAGGLFREADFRQKVRAFDWSRFGGKPVLIQGCASVTLPTWVFLVLTAELTPYAKSISYGEVKNPIPVYGALGSASTASNPS